MNASIKNAPSLRAAGLILIVMLAGLWGWIRSGSLAPGMVSPPRLARAPGNTGGVPPTAAGPQSEDISPDHGLTEEDRLFFIRTIQSAIRQDTVSRGVLRELVNPEVREYVYQMLKDEAAIRTELETLATRRGVIVPAPGKVAFRKWALEDGVIDKRYVDLVAADNAEVVALFAQATRSQDAEIAGFAKKTLPVMQNHLKAARDLKKVTD